MRDTFYIAPIKKHKSEKGLLCRRGIEDDAIDFGRGVECGDFDYNIIAIVIVAVPLLLIWFDA